MYMHAYSTYKHIYRPENCPCNLACMSVSVSVYLPVHPSIRSCMRVGAYCCCFQTGFRPIRLFSDRTQLAARLFACGPALACPSATRHLHTNVPVCPGVCLSVRVTGLQPIVTYIPTYCSCLTVCSVVCPCLFVRESVRCASLCLSFSFLVSTFSHFLVV